MKKYRKYFIALIVLIIIVFTKTFTNFLGAPLLVYLESYNGQKKGFVNPQKVYEASIFSDKHNNKDEKYALRYCNNINDITFLGEKYNDLKLVENKKNLKRLELSGSYNDWSSISNTQSIENICLIDTNFTDLSLLSNNTNLKILSIRTEYDIKYCDFNNFNHLEEFEMDGPAVSFKEIAKSTQLKKIIISNVKKIESCEDFSQLKNIDLFSIGNSNLKNNDLMAILSLNDVKNLNIYNCTYDGELSKLEKAISIMLKKGWNAEYKNGIINIFNVDN